MASKLRPDNVATLHPVYMQVEGPNENLLPMANAHESRTIGNCIKEHAAAFSSNYIIKSKVKRCLLPSRE